MTNPVCHHCNTPMHRDTRPKTLSYKGQSAVVDMPGWYCDGSDESIHVGNDMKHSNRLLTRFKARDQGLLEAEDIRRIRKQLGLKQEEAGAIIGGGPRAFQKYEMGDLLPSRAISSALVLLSEHPNGLDVLKARQMATNRRSVVTQAAAGGAGTLIEG